jgi:tetratricopeptide (TPR) repeat protein
MALDDGRHPDAERLAEYADGVLEAEARAPLEQHLADCADCRAVVMETMAFLESNLALTAGRPSTKVSPFRSRRWVIGAAAALAAAAALVLAIRLARPEWAGPLFGPRGDGPELQELIAAVANEPTRPVEGRLTGGFKYGPPPSPTRGPGDREVSPDVRIAAAKIEKLAGRRNGTVRAELGWAFLALGRLDDAIAQFERLAIEHPGDGAVQSDLSAAYLARAAMSVRPDDAPRALAAAEGALRASPALQEALFNKALALEALGRRDEARAAWSSFLDHDSAGPWAEEAKRRLQSSRAQGRLNLRTDGYRARRLRLVLGRPSAPAGAPVVL